MAAGLLSGPAGMAEEAAAAPGLSLPAVRAPQAALDLGGLLSALPDAGGCSPALAWTALSAWSQAPAARPADGGRLDEDLCLQVAGWEGRCLVPLRPQDAAAKPAAAWWRLSGPGLAAGSLVEPLAWALLRGSPGALEESCLAGSRAGGGFGLGSPSASSQVAGLGCSLGEWLEIAAFEPRAVGAEGWRHLGLGLQGSLPLDRGRGDLRGRFMAGFSEQAAAGGSSPVLVQGGADWWLDSPPVRARRLAHLQLVLGGGAEAEGVRSFVRVLGQLSLPDHLETGWLLGISLGLASAAPRSGRQDSLAWIGETKTVGAAETEAAADPDDPAAPMPLIDPGRWDLRLRGRWADAWWRDARGGSPADAWNGALCLGWRPAPGLQAGSRLDSRLGQLPWGQAGAGQVRPASLDWKTSLAGGDSGCALAADLVLGWRRDAGAAWRNDQDLRLEFGLRSREKGLEGQAGLRGGLRMSGLFGGGNPRLDEIDLGLNLGFGWPDAALRLRARLSAGVAAPPDWWLAMGRADAGLAGRCQVKAGLGLGLGSGPGIAPGIKVETAAVLAEGCTAKKLAAAWSAGTAGAWLGLCAFRLSCALSGGE